MTTELRIEPVDVVEVGNSLGESVLWDDRRRTVWWTDIHEKRLYSYDVNTRALAQWQTPARLCSFGLIEDGDSFIAAFDGGIALFDPLNSSLEWLLRPLPQGDGLRLNDGRVDRRGRFWVGSMIEPYEEKRLARGTLYCIERDGRAIEREWGISISNGLCWSPDGQTLYFADSPQRVIYAFDMDLDSGRLSGKRVFARTDKGGYPDGATVDRQGYVWSAHWNAGRIVRYSPRGEVDSILPLPVSQPTCVAFGGSELDLLIVTSARSSLSQVQLDAQPLAGHLLIYKVNFRGLPEERFRHAAM